MSATVPSATRCQAFTLHSLVRAEKPPSLAPPPSAPTSRGIQHVLGQVLGQVFSYASSHWTSQPHSKSGIIPKLQTEKLRPDGLTSNWLDWGLIAKLTSFPFKHAALTCLAWTGEEFRKHLFNKQTKNLSQRADPGEISRFLLKNFNNLLNNL